MAVVHYKDNIPPSTGIIYRIVSIGADVSHIQDVTQYVQSGTPFGEADVNATCVLECTHSRFGTNHALTTPNTTSENVKFTATASYIRGDTFTFNGTSVTAKTVDGKDLDAGIFTQGMTVTCFKHGDTLFFPYPSKTIVDDNDITNSFRIGMEDGKLYFEEN